MRISSSKTAALIFLLMAIVCALSVVASQHNARKLFIELQKEKDRAQQMEVEWGQLQLELSTWAMPGRVEKVTSAKLQMQMPQSEQMRFIRINMSRGSKS